MPHSNPIVSNDPIIDIKSVSFSQNFQLALRDILQGTKNWRLFGSLGWLDIKLRYRGSVLGPFWITIIMAVKIITIGVLYAYFFNMDMHTYLPYLSVSLILWTFITSNFIESCSIFVNAQSLILSMRLPFTIYAWRNIVSNLITLLHNSLVLILVFSWYRVIPNHYFLFAASLALLLIDSLALNLLLGVLGTRFKDIPPIMNSIMQALFFITPVIWDTSQLKFNYNYMLFNPMYPLLEITRSPLLGRCPSLSTWLAALGYSVALWIVTLLVFTKARFRIPYWM